MLQTGDADDEAARDIDWTAVERIDAWLDGEVAPEYKAHPIGQDWARVAKIGEEIGEALEELDDATSAHDSARLAEISERFGKAIDALIGCTGQNPRKGHYGSLFDLLSELADVALTGIFAIQHFTKDIDHTQDVIATRLARILTRVPQRRLCAHADQDGAGMHWLEPGENCPDERKDAGG